MQKNNKETGFFVLQAQNDTPCHCEEGKARRTQGYHYSSAPASPGIEVRNRKTIEKKGITRLAVLASNDRQAAFTLAEVLITLGIIGVVAAVTLPALITNIQSRIRAEQIRSAKYKFTLATDKMNSLGLIGPYDSTEAFVKELQKHLKLAKVCPPGQLEGCWPTKEVKIDNDGTMYEIKKAVTGKQFYMPKNQMSDYSSDNVGIVTADGVPMILNYNKKCEPLDPVKEYGWITEDNKPVSNATAGCVAAVMDINGSKKPNKLSEDVILFNALGFGTGCGFELDGKCYSVPISSFAPLSQADCEAQKNDLGIKECMDPSYGLDYWAGAVKACGGVDKMATLSDVGKIAESFFDVIDRKRVFNIARAAKMGFPNPGSSSFSIYTNHEIENYWAYRQVIYSYSTGYDGSYRRIPNAYAVCIVE